MSKINLKEICYDLIDTFLLAGKKSLELRRDGLITEYKEDNTPVSNGDLEVDKILNKKISNITPSLPIISEENSQNRFKEDLKDFWLIDPIDGTYDYINDKDEFTLNAALIVDRKPHLGLIYAPAKDRMFYSFDFGKSYELINGKEILLDCSKKTNQGEVKAVHYSDKLKPIIQELHTKYKVTEYKRMKSSLKFCVIAASEYDIYISEPRASEWDIAAGHAILKNAGGVVTDFNGNEILYGKENFKNPSLILKRNNNL